MFFTVQTVQSFPMLFLVFLLLQETGNVSLQSSCMVFCRPTCYHDESVTFLLTPVQVRLTSVLEVEKVKCQLPSFPCQQVIRKCTPHLCSFSTFPPSFPCLLEGCSLARFQTSSPFCSETMHGFHHATHRSGLLVLTSLLQMCVCVCEDHAPATSA